MNKILGFGIAGFLSMSLFLNENTTLAQTMDEQTTEDFSINWDDVWENADDLDSEVDFGVVNSQSRKRGPLAKGSTKVSLSGKSVVSTGKSKGRILTTVTSATTSLRDVAYGITSNGGKRMAVGTFTATSTTRLANTSGKSPFRGITIHTATDNGKLYSSSTGNTKAY